MPKTIYEYVFQNNNDISLYTYEVDENDTSYRLRHGEFDRLWKKSIRKADLPIYGATSNYAGSAWVFSDEPLDIKTIQDYMTKAYDANVEKFEVEISKISKEIELTRERMTNVLAVGSIIDRTKQ